MGNEEIIFTSENHFLVPKKQIIKHKQDQY